MGKILFLNIVLRSLKEMSTTYVSETQKQECFSRLMKISDNTRCFDCKCKNPQWASASFGIFICLECSGKHRSFGPHISFVRSVTLDNWQERQLLIMELGGNQKAKEFLKKNSKDKFDDYNSTLAKQYKADLESRVSIRMGERTCPEIKYEYSNRNVVEKPNTPPTNLDGSTKNINNTNGASNISPKEETINNNKDNTQKEDQNPAKPLQKKTHVVKFNTKFSKEKGKKKGLASTKIEDELDFNILTIGDQVTSKNSKGFGQTTNTDSNINEVKSFSSQNDNFQPSSNTYKSNERSSDDSNNLDKYKNLQGVGSDMLSNQKDSEPR